MTVDRQRCRQSTSQSYFFISASSRARSHSRSDIDEGPPSGQQSSPRPLRDSLPDGTPVEQAYRMTAVMEINGLLAYNIFTNNPTGP